MKKLFIISFLCFFVNYANAQNFDQPSGVLTSNIASPYDANSIIASYKGLTGIDQGPVWTSIKADVLLTDNFVSGVRYNSYSIGYYSNKEIGLSSNYKIKLNKNWNLCLGLGLGMVDAKMDYAGMYQYYLSQGTSIQGIPLENQKFSSIRTQGAFLISSKSWFFGLNLKYLIADISDQTQLSVDDKQKYNFQFIAGKNFILVPTVLDLQGYIKTDFSDFDLFKSPENMPLECGLNLDIYQHVNIGIYGKYPEGVGFRVSARNDLAGVYYSYFADTRVGFVNPTNQIGIIIMLDKGLKKPLLRTEFGGGKQCGNIFY